MRSANVGTRLLEEKKGAYEGRLVVSLDTVTSRDIRRRMLRVFAVSPDGGDIFVVPTDVTHAAANGITKKEAGVLADELVGGFYEQYEIARAMRAPKWYLRDIDPKRCEEGLRCIYDEIRNRTLEVLRDDR
jgi:hypothetical protein